MAGIKDVSEARSGETVTEAGRPTTEPLMGYREPKPMVFCGLYPVDGDDYSDFRDALDRLRLNDSSFTFEPETSGVLGFGFRCGFLGLLHMEIVRERLEREFDLSLIATVPSVEYRAHLVNGQMVEVDNPADMPPPNKLKSIEEPFLTLTILLPTDYTGAVIDLCQGRRGEMKKMEYLSPERLELVYRVPLAEVIIDFFDQLKSRTKGYASLDYEPDGYEESDLVKVDLLLNGQPADAFSCILHKSRVGGLRPADDREAEGADPPPAVRRPHPGRHRRAHHRPHHGEGRPQGRHRQVLRRRHHPEEQAPRQAEGGEEADEVDRTGRGAAGGVHLRPPSGGVT